LGQWISGWKKAADADSLQGLERERRPGGGVCWEGKGSGWGLRGRTARAWRAGGLGRGGGGDGGGAGAGDAKTARGMSEFHRATGHGRTYKRACCPRRRTSPGSRLLEGV